MDITQRQITKISRGVSKFTVRTLRTDSVGASEPDLIHAVRKNPGITQAEVCRITGMDKDESRAGFPEMTRRMKGAAEVEG